MEGDVSENERLPFILLLLHLYRRVEGAQFSCSDSTDKHTIISDSKATPAASMKSPVTPNMKRKKYNK